MPIFLWYLKIIHVLKYNISQSLVQKIYKMSFFGDYKISVGFFLFFYHTQQNIYTSLNLRETLLLQLLNLTLRENVKMTIKMFEIFFYNGTF